MFRVFKNQSSRRFLKRAVGVAGISLLTVGGTAYAAQDRKITPEELAKHNKPDDLWVSANGKVYDLTEFKEKHPGGKDILIQYAGKNASKIFNHHHSPTVPDFMLPADKHVGVLDGELEDAGDVTEEKGYDREALKANMPDLSMIFSASDFEYVARRIISPSAWSYYSSAADDMVTYRENHNAFSRIYLKPRICRDVSATDMRTTMLGEETSAPFYCSAAAQAKLGNPEDGETAIARGCGSSNIIQMISTYASVPAESIWNQIKGQIQWFQLYTSSEPKDAETLIDQATGFGAKAIFVTVDTPELGNREKDKKHRAESGTGSSSDGVADLSKNVVYGAAHPVTWDDLQKWQKRTDVPIVVKGVQSAEDVVLAAEKGVKAVVISNHGGRQLDFSRAPIEVLHDSMELLRAKGLQDDIEIYIDGGVRRGTDILKAVAMGAKGVGLGRMFLYANSAYGEEGVEKLCTILKSEIAAGMKMLGVNKLSELGPEYLDCRGLHSHVSLPDHAYYRDFEPVAAPKFKDDDSSA